MRNLLNQEIPKHFGEYYHIKGIMPYEKREKKFSFEYNEYNNTWMNIKKVQSFMVRYYNIQEQECEGKLVFVVGDNCTNFNTFFKYYSIGKKVEIPGGE